LSAVQAAELGYANIREFGGINGWTGKSKQDSGNLPDQKSGRFFISPEFA